MSLRILSLGEGLDDGDFKGGYAPFGKIDLSSAESGAIHGGKISDFSILSEMQSCSALRNAPR